MDVKKWSDNIDLNKITVGEFLKKSIENISEETMNQLKIKFCVKKIMQLYHCAYGNVYEALLHCKLNDASSEQDKNKVKEHLNSYYEFLATFNYYCNLEPIFESSYNVVADTVLYWQCEKIYEHTHGLVTTHCKEPHELSKQIMDMLCTDIELKPKMVRLLERSGIERNLFILCKEIESRL